MTIGTEAASVEVDTARFKYSVLITLADRNPVDLQKFFFQLAKAVGQRRDIEYVIGIDGKDGDPWFKIMMAIAEMGKADIAGCIVPWDTATHVPESFSLQDGHNNPASINNHLLKHCRGDNILFLSSDTLVQPFLFERIDSVNLDKMIWCSRVIDYDTASEYCGTSRLFPMMWCMAISKRQCPEFDEEYTMGMGWEDTDWVARAAINTGKIAIDMGHLAIHQTHAVAIRKGQIASGKAYSEEAKPGWDRSYKYTIDKWGGRPLSKDQSDPLKVSFAEVGDLIMLYIDREASRKPSAKASITSNA